MPPGDRDLDLAVLRLAWRIDALDKWREGVDAGLSELARSVDDMSRAEEIAAAVSHAVRKETREQNTLRLSKLQQLGAFLAGALIIADTVRGLL